MVACGCSAGSLCTDVVGSALMRFESHSLATAALACRARDRPLPGRMPGRTCGGCSLSSRCAAAWKRNGLSKMSQRGDLRGPAASTSRLQTSLPCGRPRAQLALPGAQDLEGARRQYDDVFHVTKLANRFMLIREPGDSPQANAQRLLEVQGAQSGASLGACAHHEAARVHACHPPPPQLAGGVAE